MNYSFHVTANTEIHSVKIESNRFRIPSIFKIDFRKNDGSYEQTLFRISDSFLLEDSFRLARYILRHLV